nr:hypothetical protein [uncultured bacterium]
MRRYLPRHIMIPAPASISKLAEYGDISDSDSESSPESSERYNGVEEIKSKSETKSYRKAAPIPNSKNTSCESVNARSAAQ